MLVVVLFVLDNFRIWIMADMWENAPSKYQLINIWMKHWKWQRNELFRCFLTLSLPLFLSLSHSEHSRISVWCSCWCLIVMRLIFSSSSALCAATQHTNVKNWWKVLWQFECEWMRCNYGDYVIHLNRDIHARHMLFGACVCVCVLFNPHKLNMSRFY